MAEPGTDAAHRLSPEEAAAKADALIAQYRATRPTRPATGAIPGLRPTPLPRVSRGLGLRTALAAAFAAGALAAGGWHGHPFAWVAVVGVLVVAFGPRLVARNATPSTGDAP